MPNPVVTAAGRLRLWGLSVYFSDWMSIANAASLVCVVLWVRRMYGCSIREVTASRKLLEKVAAEAFGGKDGAP